MKLSLFALLLLISLFLATAVSPPSALQSEPGNGNDSRLLKGENETSLRNNNVQKQDGDEGDKIDNNIKKSGGGGHGRGAAGGAGGNGIHHSMNRRKNGASTRSGSLIFALILSFVCAYIQGACPAL